MEAPSSAVAYDQILALERNLLAASKCKGSFDPAVRRLRTSIRDSYEALILKDLAFCEAFEVEQALWRLHYREIEGFRVKIRKLLTVQEQTEGPEPAVGNRKKRKREPKKEPLLRALASLRSFLGEASGFFHGLLIKLRLQHGLASSLGNTDRFSAEGDVTEELRRCMVTCNRVLVYLGDLARYKELYAVMDSSVRNWSVAANYYKQAAVLWPSSGNPYNQLAVLCTYCGNNLTALYLYCRSLAVSVPFETAWDNVFLLLEKNKQVALQVSSPGSDVDKRIRVEITLPTNLHGFVVEQDLWSLHKVARSQVSFIILFIDLVRTLLVQSSTDELDRAFIAVDRKHERFLYEAMKDVKSSKLEGSLPLALQMTVILIFCMHHNIGQPGLNGEYVLNSSLKFTLKFCSMMAKVAQQKSWLAFPVTVILMEWLSCQNKVLQTFKAKEGNGPVLSNFCERVVALDSILSRNMVDHLGCDAQLLQQDHTSGIFKKAQWEDHELLGFVPLANIHLTLDFSSQLPGYGISKLATYSCWRLRCTDALQKLWNLVGKSGHGCLLKMPDVSRTSSATEESNPTPSLKEWIEKTFFSSDLSVDLGGAKRVEVLSNQTEAHLPDEVISPAHCIEHTLPCEIVCLTRSKANVVSGREASTGKVMPCCQQSLEQDKEINALEQQKVLTRKEMVMAEEISSVNGIVKKGTISVNVDLGQVAAGDFNRGAKVTNTLASHISNQALPSVNPDRKFSDMERETDFSFGKEAQVFTPRQAGAISNLPALKTSRPVLCFDNVSHVKPRGFVGAFSSLRPKDCWSSLIKFDRQLGIDNKAYDTDNPFVLRLRHLSK
ncbi:hypothetical protein L7F22_030241 [Adiantum nelumboides]|nr:hypothetical protein [Adiantum nelumboides]